MDCDTLPDTGGPALVLAVMAVVCLVAGAVLLRHARRERVAPVVMLALLVVAAAYATLTGAPAQASSGCETDQPDGQNSLRITQTSVLAGLGPEAAPLAIAGRVTNDSDDDTYITAVTVTLTSVAKASHAAAGPCDVSDYVLAEPRMPVGRALPPHGSLAFSGATIGFGNKSVNQDACKGATIKLRYYSAATPDPRASR